MQRRARDEHGSDRGRRPGERVGAAKKLALFWRLYAGYGVLDMSLVAVLGSIGMAFSSAPRSQPRPSELYPAYFDSLPSMAGKTVVITGASRGLGYVTALSVARKGAAVFMVGRRSARADESLEAIRIASTGPAPQLVECDLLDFGSVRRAAAALQERAGDIDALCCNAGIMMQPDEASKDGYDVTIATNVLSHFLLARELLPTLEVRASLTLTLAPNPNPDPDPNRNPSS